jgi:hypothetical protein
LKRRKGREEGKGRRKWEGIEERKHRRKDE